MANLDEVKKKEKTTKEEENQDAKRAILKNHSFAFAVSQKLLKVAEQ